jgi:pantoate--beta-alanine ligase
VRVVHRLEELRAARAGLPRPLGLVPTMGALHAGHLSLVRRARAECASLAVSIFVNPTQFGPDEDLQAYPRDLKRDLEQLAPEGVDLVWAPEVHDLYPPGDQTWVSVERLTRGLEGGRRPGHFRGVATVVTKLFHAFEPQRAYFGQKDAQQAAVIRRMARDLLFPLEVVVYPTVREPDGLALSSRNRFLSDEERRAATVLFRALCAASEAFASGERDAERMRQAMRAVLASEPRARPHYVSAADLETLDELEGNVNRALLSMAVAIGGTTLIDNVIVGGGE